jgi:hypothetical protein
MVQVDLPAAFAIGQVFAALSQTYLRREPQLFTHRLLGPFNFFMACCFAPVGMYLMIGWPAWEVMYQTPWPEDPFNRPWVAAFYAGFGVIMVVLGNVGFILAHHWYRTGRATWVRVGMAVGGLLTVLPFLLRWGIWMRIGTYADVRGGGGYRFWDAPFFPGWLVMMSAMAVSVVVMGLVLRRLSRRME